MEQNENKKRVFIVNDEKSLLDMYSLAFGEQGFGVVEAFGGIDAIEKLRGGIECDVALIDITAPVMDSLDLLDIIRVEKLIPNAKVIILSNEEKPVFDERGRALNVAGYVTKVSTTPSQIVQKVITILNTTDPFFK